MNTVGKMYEYQDAYRSNGMDFDVHPKSNKAKRKKSEISASDKKKIICLLLAGGLICIGLIIVAAYGASINYANNQLRDSNTALKGEVESLQIEMQTANNIATIERKATKELGMVYPEGKQLVVLTGNEEPDANFAANLKKEAFE